MNERDVEAMARTIFGEARGEGLMGLEAVASVILNRVKKSKKYGRYWWGNTISEVCHSPWQFSCWNPNDPNYNILRQEKITDANFALCLRIARRACGGVLQDKTCRATHYHHKSLCPKWSIGKIPCAEIGQHIFYNDIES